MSRSDVDKMVAGPPDALSNVVAAKEPVSKPPPKTKRAGSDESDSEEGETPAKKPKKEEPSTLQVDGCCWLCDDFCFS